MLYRERRLPAGIYVHTYATRFFFIYNYYQEGTMTYVLGGGAYAMISKLGQTHTHLEC